MRANDRGNPYGLPSGRVMLTVTYGALSNTSNAKAASIWRLAFLIRFSAKLEQVRLCSRCSFGSLLAFLIILIFYLAMQESHFLGLFLVHQEVNGLALIAEFTLGVGNLCTDIGKIPHLF